MKKVTRYSVVAMNSKGTFEWVVGQYRNGRYQYGRRRNPEWSYREDELEEFAYEDDDMTCWEDLLNTVDDVKARGRSIAFVSPGNVRLSNLAQETIITRMAAEVSRMSVFYRKLLKRNQVDAGLILRLVELEKSLDVVSRTSTRRDGFALGDAVTTDYYGSLEFDAIPAVETDTRTATYARYRLTCILDELRAHQLTKMLVSERTRDIIFETAESAVGFDQKEYNAMYGIQEQVDV